MSTRLGNAVLRRVVETSFAPGFTMFGGTPEDAWAENADLLEPTFVDLAAHTWRVAIQTWVLDVDGSRILIDTGVGNGKRRPAIPVLDGLDTGFLTALESAGVPPESVDIVVNTHLHSDHVGWNTRTDGAGWTPTFPNARYLMPEADFRHFGPEGPGCDDAARIVFDDSVAPVYEAGQVEMFGGEHQLSESVWLRPAAGHTPGSSVLWLDAGAPAVFVGDLTHCAIQIPRPVMPAHSIATPHRPRRPASGCSPRRPAAAQPSSRRTTPATVGPRWWRAVTPSRSTTGWTSNRSRA